MAGNNVYKYTPDELQMAIDRYFEDRQGQRVSVPDLCTYLGISNDTWARYKDNNQRGEIAKKADTRIAALLSTSSDSRMIAKDIFLLKACHGLSDQPRIAIDHQISVRYSMSGLKDLAT